MKSNEVVNLELQLSTDQVEISINKIVNSLTELQETLTSIGNEFSEVFITIQKNVEILGSSMEKMSTPIAELAKSLNTVSELDFSTLVTELGELKDTLVDIYGQMEEQQTQDLITEIVSDGVGIAQLGWDIYEKLSKESTNSKGGSKGGIKVKVRKKGKSSKSDASGIAAGGIGTVLGLDALDGTLGDILSDATEGIGGLSGAFDNIVTKIKDSTAATWLQNAATTAWQGISTATTAVTTAFGAAVNFLTSPIGLVVLAIAALIAIIVLLVANWDTVKEALLTAWEAVKNAVAVAVDWISTKVQEGMAFVQNIFAGISEFMQGIFAKDWTEQFGAFGNVLNAFFANVENVWNAVKSIFGGIVDFVKNVFAGDWGAAWDSVVGIFKGIWDLLVSIVKAPINVIIGLINGLVQGVVDGINLVINALNDLSFDIPDWVPILGGQKFGFNLTPLIAPKIPLLAKGAVLPANKPFLAMVGDQRHGTNVEAPLATIQEAVAMVMEDQFNGMMAGFEAVTARQEQILETLLGIEIGDTTIGQAAARYNRKMAIIKGGM